MVVAGGLAVFAHGDAAPRVPVTVEYRYCGSYVPLSAAQVEALDPAAPLPPGSTTSCSTVVVTR